jgi:regulator of ribosome biosynthesis
VSGSFWDDNARCYIFPWTALTYRSNLNPHLLALALTSTQSLISALFNLPTHPSDSGPTAKLPTPTTPLPREKPLPKPKPPTKWERFAKEKGISHSKKDRDVWDDDKQAWVSRWGKGGKNKEQEGAWLTEVKQKDGRSRSDYAWR